MAEPLCQLQKNYCLFPMRFILNITEVIKLIQITECMDLTYEFETSVTPVKYLLCLNTELKRDKKQALVGKPCSPPSVCTCETCTLAI